MICVDAGAIGVARPDKVLFDGVSLTIARGDRVAIVGINGSGKSTLARILAGEAAPNRGVVRFGRDVRIAHLDQDPQLAAGTVRSYLGDNWEVAAIATSLGLQPLLDRPAGELSGGQAKRVALARTLVGDFDLVLLDEPTNHLDLEAIEWLEQRLASSAAALVFITHDRHLMDRLTTGGPSGSGRVVELDRGGAYVHRAESGTSAYAAYLDGRAAREERSANDEATRRILARRELEWLRRGAPARSTKPKARLRSARDIVAGGGAAGPGVRDSDLLLDVGTSRLGNEVLELTDVAQAYDGRTVFSGVDLVVEPGARLGVVGPNGSGKSTLLDIIAGRREPAAGNVRRGATVVTGYADQRTTTLDPNERVLDIVAGPLRQPDWQDKALLERFWFDSTAQHAPVRLLSGGERRRLQLVMVLATRPNLLVLDEPTNDLDLDTLRALEAFLDEWPGALVVATHDRTFLDRTVDHVLAIGGDGSVRRVAGGVQGWLAERATPTRHARQPTTPSTTTGPRDRPPRGPSPSTIGRRLRDTEQAIAKAQRNVDRLREALGATTDHRELATVGAELAAAQAELDLLEERWLELADLQSG